jgi:hypothetical protein
MIFPPGDGNRLKSVKLRRLLFSLRFTGAMDHRGHEDQPQSRDDLKAVFRAKTPMLLAHVALLPARAARI